MDIKIPEALKIEHEELHAQLSALSKAPGRVGEAARDVARLLHPHFVKEEEYALPPLGLLATVAQGMVMPAMRAVVAMTDRLKRELPEMLAEHRVVVAALEKLVALIDEMLAVADMDRGTLSLEVEEVDLAPVLRQIAEDVGRHYDAVKLELEVPERLVGAADPIRFTEVVRQLLDNACRFSPAGEPVMLKGRAMDEGTLVSVTDRGEGLAREVASKAFDEPFSAGEEILRKERAGAGVGLHLARQLVIEHGGIMWADPLPAGGTRVSFVIPARPGGQVPGAEAPASSGIRSVTATGFSL